MSTDKTKVTVNKNIIAAIKVLKAGACAECEYGKALSALEVLAFSGNPVSTDEIKRQEDYLPIPSAELDADGLLGCPVPGCDRTLLSQSAYELHYKMRHSIE